MVEVVEQTLHLTCEDLSQLPEVAAQIVEFKENLNIIIFRGDLGAGKTTLIKSICEVINVLDNVSSPTFAIINEYVTKSGDDVHHFDFYRINEVQEVLDIGVEEYFYSGDLCLIEWSEIVQHILPQPYLSVHIEVGKSESRIFHVEKNG